jgi:hypothetical protein
VAQFFSTGLISLPRFCCGKPLFTTENLFQGALFTIPFAGKLIWSKYRKLKLFIKRTNLQNCFGFPNAKQQEAVEGQVPDGDFCQTLKWFV